MEARQQDLVSVIIPAYNAEKYIRHTVESVLNQTWKNLEIIIINDGSTDNTGNILTSYKDDIRIKIIEQENQGCSTAKNTGLHHSIGNYIQYLDADDLLSEDKIAEQVKELKNKPLGIAVCKTVVFEHPVLKNTGFEIDTAYLYSTKNTFDFLINLYGRNGRMGMIQPNAYLMPRDLIEKTGKWDTSLSPSPDEDGEYFCRAILAASEIIYTEGINYYRKIKSTSSLSKGKSFLFAKGAFKSVQLKAEHLLEINNSETVKEILSKQFASIAYLYGPNYPEIVLMVKTELNKLGINKMPDTGGTKFKMLSAVIGIDKALKFKRFLSKKHFSQSVQ